MKKISTQLLFIPLFFALNVMAQDGALDLTFNSTDKGFGNTNGSADETSFAFQQSDGKVIVAGDFNYYNAQNTGYIVRIDTAANIDATYNTGTGFNGFVLGGIMLADGKVILVGEFTEYNGTPVDYIVRLNTDGTLDPTFTTTNGVDSHTRGIAMQSDGKFILVGEFTNYIIRLNSDGTVDNTFDPGTGPDDNVFGVTVASDDKIIIYGEFGEFDGTDANYVARLNSDGSLDAAFNTTIGADGDVFTAAIQADGKVIIGGDFYTYNNFTVGNIARLNANGSLDGSFATGNGFNDPVNALLIQDSGKILVGGNFDELNNVDIYSLVRLNTNGSVDASFSTTVESYVNAISPLNNGLIMVSGNLGVVNTIYEDSETFLNADGSIHNSFLGTGANGYAYTSLSQADGKVLIGGEFTAYNAVAVKGLARLNADGTLDNSYPAVFAGADYSALRDMKFQSDGKVIIGGSFSKVHGVTRNYIARLNTDGTLDATFDSGSNTAEASSFAIQNDGKIVAIGQYSVVRFDTDGALDPAFNIGFGPDNNLAHIALQSDGKIIVSGNFGEFGGSTANRIVRLNANGSVDATFNVAGVGANGTILKMAITDDDKIYIGGSFTSYNGTPVNRFARLNADGTLDNSFTTGTGFDNVIYSMATQGDGKILVGGYFTMYNGTNANSIIRLNDDGSVDTNFDSGTGLDGAPTHIGFFYDDKILLSGDFVQYNGVGRNRILRILNPGISNDAPVISNAALTASVSEAASNGTSVVTVTSTDPEMDDVAYTITAGNSAGKFSINGTTGEITVSGVLDYESTNSYSITVSATDDGIPIKTTSAVFVITVQDANDTPITSNQTFSIVEGSSPGTSVGTVSASDPDAGQTLSYSIINGNTGAAFAINSSTGEITVSNTLDEDIISSYSLTVQIEDDGSPVKSTTGVITIGIITGVLQYATTMDVALYPNPATGSFVVQGEGAYQLRILDLSGHAVKEVTTDNNPVDIEELHAGVYIIEIIQHDRRVQKKLIVE